MQVDISAIEKQLSGLWRNETEDSERAVTKAALWNVIAHTSNADDHAIAAQVLGRASAAVPQRTIIVRADPEGESELSAWISANCHMLGKGRQVCSEEIAITASGSRVNHVGPIVSALLLPDMPVAVWWLGDLPEDSPEYVETLLAPADRLIVDSAQFSSAADFALVKRIADETTTAPADLNWARLEEWRTVTAAAFDPAELRPRLASISKVRITIGDDSSFGGPAEGLLYVAWLSAQTGRRIPFQMTGRGTGIDIETDAGSVCIHRNTASGALVARIEGGRSELDIVAPALARNPDDLIVRLLKNPVADRVYLRALGEVRLVA